MKKLINEVFVEADREKLKDSKGNVYQSCPYIEDIQALLLNNSDVIPKEIIVEISQKLEKIRRINEILRDENNEPYNFSAVIKQIKILCKDKQEEINKIIELYY